VIDDKFVVKWRLVEILKSKRMNFDKDIIQDVCSARKYGSECCC